MIRIENILVATDFGEASDAALAYGRTLARTFGARLHVLHVSQNALSIVGPEPFGMDFAKLQADIDEAARVKLHHLVSEQDRTDLRALMVVRHTSAPAYEIIAYAREANIDLMVVGTHGRRAMAHLLMGSVAEKVVRLAPCPVLTVHHPEHEFVLPEALQIVTQGGRS